MQIKSTVFSKKTFYSISIFFFLMLSLFITISVLWSINHTQTYNGFIIVNSENDTSVAIKVRESDELSSISKLKTEKTTNHNVIFEKTFSNKSIIKEISPIEFSAKSEKKNHFYIIDLQNSECSDVSYSISLVNHDTKDELKSKQLNVSYIVQNKEYTETPKYIGKLKANQQESITILISPCAELEELHPMPTLQFDIKIDINKA